MQNRAFAIQDTTSTGLQRYIQASKYSFRNLPCSQFPWDSFESSISVHGQPNYAYFEPKSPFAATSSKVRFRHASSYLGCRRVHRFRQGGKWCPSDDFLNGVPESPFYSIEHFFRDYRWGYRPGGSGSGQVLSRNAGDLGRFVRLNKQDQMAYGDGGASSPPNQAASASAPLLEPGSGGAGRRWPCRNVRKGFLFLS